ncbi:hypothetical protein [Entomobacter blattae]|uniref:Uncharacterized protein n=1 Tax=Entomobacter blattae TaxID=2762277 RepID=A0A7H1NQ64_9PROT|nr:hypothetical protein [Entomobacter blattae]QNT77924.1 hypothetical protein JGUZn3_06820 [Entomobacter blattae]
MERYLSTGTTTLAALLSLHRNKSHLPTPEHMQNQVRARKEKSPTPVPATKKPAKSRPCPPLVSSENKELLEAGPP